jgi:multidrug efflux system membrane fusion protein
VGGYLAWPKLYPQIAQYIWTARQDQSGKQAGKPVPVHAQLVGREDFRVFLNGLGTAQAWTSVAVRSRVDGQVVKIAFKEGQLVHEGDILVELDARPFQAAADQATAKIAQDKANLTSAEADLARTKSLLGNGYATKQLFDQQTGTVNQLQALIKADEAALENAKVSLSYTTIRAPITGRLGLRNIDVGNIVHAGDANGVVSIAEIQPIAVLFTAPEAELPRIIKGLKDGPLKLTALTPDGKTELGQGELSIVDNDIDVNSGTIRLKGRFENHDSTIWPGMSVTTRLLVATLHDVVVVPDSAIQHGPQGLYAYVVNQDHKAEKRDVKVSRSDSGFSVVDSGLQVGDEVITSGHYRVQPGLPVSVQLEHGARTANTQSDPQVE